MLKTVHLYDKFTGSWTRGIASKRYAEFVPGTLYEAFGVALCFYRPDKRLSVSIWWPTRSYNFRVWGPQKFSWEH